MASSARDLALLLLAVMPATLPAQRWVGGAELPLVRQASAQRRAQATDTALASWRATATGLLRLGPVADMGAVPSAVPAKADELTVAVYGRLPDRVKQVIKTWNDTILLPMMGVPRYHRDHLGIVSSDFGDRIRLGDGDEVRDLIHPLSADGLTHYEFAAGDTVRINLQGEIVLVAQVSVRPRNPTSPGTIGTLYIDPERRALVRFRFTFTPESYRDPSVRDITVTLETSLFNSTYWLPSRQSIVIRREGRENGMIRADWQIHDYVFGDRSADSLFRQGRDSFPAIAGPMAARGSFSGETSIATVLPRVPTVDAGIRTTAQEASVMLEGRPLEGKRGIRILPNGLFSVNRVQGYSLAPGVAFPIGTSLTLTARAGYGFSDQRVVGLARLEGPVGAAAWRVEGSHMMEDVGDTPQFVGPLSFLYPVISGRDPSDWTLISRGLIGLRLPVSGYQITLDGGVERSESVTTRLRNRDFDRLNPALGVGTATVARASIGRMWSNENAFEARAEVGRGDADWQRYSGGLTLKRTAGTGRAVLSLSGGVGSRGLPGYRNFVLGGPSTLPGVSSRSLGGRYMALADLSYERRFSIMRLLGIGPRGRAAGANTVAPFIAAGLAGGDQPLLPWRGDKVVTPAVGIRFNIGGVVMPFGVGLR